MKLWWIFYDKFDVQPYDISFMVAENEEDLFEKYCVYIKERQYTKEFFKEYYKWGIVKVVGDYNMTITKKVNKI